jgi:hypothetical protein
MSRLLHNSQLFDEYRYQILDLIEASKDLKIINLKVADIFANYDAPNDTSLMSFIEHCKRTTQADLSFPIILSPCNFILDGKHRLAKAILTGEKTIKAVRFKKMPDCGEYEEN